MTSTGQLFYDAQARPLINGAPLPLASYVYMLSGTTTPAAVYRDSGLTTPYPTSAGGSYIVTADGTGLFPQIFLNPGTIYRVQLYNSLGVLQQDQDPFVTSFPVTGNGAITFNSQGEMTINAPTPGGTGNALSITPPAGGQSLKIAGSAAGNAALTLNNVITAGTQTATFTATNKPGSGTTAPSKWMPITCDGATYYLPLWL